MTGIAFASGVRTSFAIAALIAGVATTLPASAQQPSKAATDAVRSNCRSDYMAKCMSVKPGGIEAIQCLKKNEASLSAACQSAVAAIKLPGEAAPTAAPAQPAAPPPAAAAPAPATRTAPPPAASVPKPAAPATAVAAPSKPAPPKPVQAKPAAAPKPVVATAPAAPKPVAAPPPPAPGPKLGPLQEAQIVRNSCTVDFQVLCKGVQLGEGRAINCLAASRPALSPNCKQAMTEIGR